MKIISTTTTKTNRGCWFRVFYSSHQPLNLAGLKGEEGSGKAIEGDPWKASVVLWLEGVGMGSWRWAGKQRGILCDWFGEQSWLSLVCSELEASSPPPTPQKNKWVGVSSLWPDSVSSGQVAAHLWFGFPRWLLLKLWVSVLFSYSLSIVCLDIRCPHRKHHWTWSH